MHPDGDKRQVTALFGVLHGSFLHVLKELVGERLHY
jgi:hypothetical protein